MNPITLRILSPAGVRAQAGCDSVTLIIKDGKDFSGGGSLGIRKGHIPMIAALEEGSSVRAFSNGEEILSVGINGGFASVENDIVTVIER